MSTTQYELVFYGELAQGVDAAQAKRNVAELFKASVEQVERMFSGQRVVIRNKLDADTAQKYVLAMQKRGALCKVEIMGGASPLPVSEQIKPEVAVRPAPPEKPVAVAPSATGQPLDRREHLAKAGRLPIAGDKVDAILATANISIAPVGQRLSDEHHVEALDFSHLDAIDLAPLGAILQEGKDEIPVSIPDVSHLKIE